MSTIQEDLITPVRDFGVRLTNLLVGNVAAGSDPDRFRKTFAINICSALGVIVAVNHAITAFKWWSLASVAVDLALILCLTIAFLILRFRENYRVPSYLAVGMMGVFLLYLFFTGGVDYSGNIWAFIYPVLCFFLLGRTKGLTFVGVYILLCLAASFIPRFPFMSFEYPPLYLNHYFTSFAILTLVTYVLEFTREKAQAIMLERNLALEKTIGELHSYQAKIKEMAYHDSLTGLPNRALLYEHIDAAIRIAERENGILALLFIDLDRFKEVNDTKGHEIGDLLLKKVADKISECVRRSDTIARLGGDEFVVLLPKIRQIEEAGLIAEKIVAAFHQPLVLSGTRFEVTVSLGIATYPADGRDLPSLLRHSDEAMYLSKGDGRDRFRFYQTGSGDPAASR